MSGTVIGIEKTAAAKVGVSVEEYRRRLSVGEKWCTRCRSFHPRTAFGRDILRSDGLAAHCLASRRVRVRKDIRGIARRRGWLKPTRDGDKGQARARVNYLVSRGVIPAPSDLPCIDCADMVFVGEYRHEYDHAKGYSAEHQLYVEPVCSRCHHRREEARRGPAR